MGEQVRSDTSRPRVTVTGTLATTQPMSKYGGIQLALVALEQMRDQIKAGGAPMHLNHRANGSLDSTILDVRIEQISDTDHALVIDFDANRDAWEAVEDEWNAAGAPGGFSAAITQLQEKLAGPQVPPAVLASDAAAYTDEERTEAARLISQPAAVEVRRLFQFSDLEFAKIALEFTREVGAGLLVGAVCYLVGRRDGDSHVEIRRTEANGTTTTAVLDTSDPEIVRAALESLDSLDVSPQVILIYNGATGVWEEEGRE